MLISCKAIFRRTVSLRRGTSGVYKRMWKTLCVTKADWPAHFPNYKAPDDKYLCDEFIENDWRQVFKVIMGRPGGAWMHEVEEFSSAAESVPLSSPEWNVVQGQHQFVLNQHEEAIRGMQNLRQCLQAVGNNANDPRLWSPGSDFGGWLRDALKDVIGQQGASGDGNAAGDDQEEDEEPAAKRARDDGADEDGGEEGEKEDKDGLIEGAFVRPPAAKQAPRPDDIQALLKTAKKRLAVLCRHRSDPGELMPSIVAREPLDDSDSDDAPAEKAQRTVKTPQEKELVKIRDTRKEWNLFFDECWHTLGVADKMLECSRDRRVGTLANHIQNRLSGSGHDGPLSGMEGSGDILLEMTQKNDSMKVVKECVETAQKYEPWAPKASGRGKVKKEEDFCKAIAQAKDDPHLMKKMSKIWVKESLRLTGLAKAKDFVEDFFATVIDIKEIKATFPSLSLLELVSEEWLQQLQTKNLEGCLPLAVTSLGKVPNTEVKAEKLLVLVKNAEYEEAFILDRELQKKCMDIKLLCVVSAELKSSPKGLLVRTLGEAVGAVENGIRMEDSLYKCFQTKHTGAVLLERARVKLAEIEKSAAQESAQAKAATIGVSLSQEMAAMKESWGLPNQPDLIKNLSTAFTDADKIMDDLQGEKLVQFRTDYGKHMQTCLQHITLRCIKLVQNLTHKLHTGKYKGEKDGIIKQARDSYAIIAKGVNQLFQGQKRLGLYQEKCSTLTTDAPLSPLEVVPFFSMLVGCAEVVVKLWSKVPSIQSESWVPLHEEAVVEHKAKLQENIKGRSDVAVLLRKNLAEVASSADGVEQYLSKKLVPQQREALTQSLGNNVDKIAKGMASLKTIAAELCEESKGEFESTLIPEGALIVQQACEDGMHSATPLLMRVATHDRDAGFEKTAKKIAVSAGDLQGSKDIAVKAHLSDIKRRCARACVNLHAKDTVGCEELYQNIVTLNEAHTIMQLALSIDPELCGEKAPFQALMEKIYEQTSSAFLSAVDVEVGRSQKSIHPKWKEFTDRKNKDCILRYLYTDEFNNISASLTTLTGIHPTHVFSRLPVVRMHFARTQ